MGGDRQPGAPGRLAADRHLHLPLGHPAGGLILNALLGWWWADPVAALVMVPIIVKEGVEALRGETCCEGTCH